MPKIFLKIIPALVFWGIFIFIINQIPYPDSLTQANFTQILPFFISLYVALIFTINILLRNILLSTIISLGIIFFLILQSLNSLNIVTGILTAVAIGLLASYFWKTKRNLTKRIKIPKLTRSL